MNYEAVRNDIKGKVLEELSFRGKVSDEDVSGIIDDFIIDECHHIFIPQDLKFALKKEIFNSIRKLDVLQDLMDDREITEVMVNGKDHIFYEKNGRLFQWDKGFESEEKLEDVIIQIVGKSNKKINQLMPIVDTRLPDGSRVNAVLKPVAVNGPSLTIRKFFDDPVTLDRLIVWGAINEEAADFLKVLVKSGYNIFICGSTGSGKTTFLNALAEYVPLDERVVTIEDCAELKLGKIKNLVSLESRVEGEDGKEISIRDLIKNSLRMRPNRIIVGEVRGAEAIDMIQAMNTGHAGSMSTGHGNSVSDMIARIETMVLMGMDIPMAAVRSQIASSIDVFVFLGRLRDKSRKVLEITEIDGIKDGEIKLNVLYRFFEAGENEEGIVTGNLRKEGSLIHKRKLLEAGIHIP